MRTLGVGVSRRNPLGRVLAVAVALSACVGRIGAADDASLSSHVIFDPSITVSEVPQRAAPRAATGLVITPIFDTSITSDPNAVTIMNTINAAIAVYQASFSDSITVSIKFQEMTTGLGQSQPLVPCGPCASVCGCGSISYTSYLAALSGHATTASDATALAHLPSGPNNPANGTANVWVNLDNLRALGFAADPPPGFPDSTIGLNTSICNLNRSSIDPSKYDLMAVVEHEIDESLGWISALNHVELYPFAGFPADLFRYDQAGKRSFSTTPTAQAFFSIDGTTQLVQFNQTPPGDFNDWLSPTIFPPPQPHTPRVQDAFSTPGATPDLGVELTALDVIGYSLVGTPTSPSDDSGFVPPDKNTAKCETGVAKNVSKLASCIETCHTKAATAALNGKSFGEEACEQTDAKKSCRAKYDAAAAKLLAKGNCPACLDTTHQAALADGVATDLDTSNGALYCAGTVALGGDDLGFVPPDADTMKCETGVAKNVSKLNSCIETCHTKAATAALNGKSFDEEACEQTNAKKSCRAKYDAAAAKLLAKGTCPDCLDASHQAALADQAETDLDAGNGTLYCAGTVPLVR